MLNWVKRPKVEEKNSVRRRIWTIAGGGCFRVVHSQFMLNERIAERARAEGRSPELLADAWYAMIQNEFGGWDVLSRHRKRGPAFAACERVIAMALREARG